MNLHARQDLPHFLNALGLTGAGAEIGVWDGGFARTILSSWEGTCLYLVDAWREMGDFQDACRSSNAIQPDVLMKTIENVRPWWDRVRIIQSLSVNAARLIPDASLDFIHIDANHAYEHVTADLVAWYPKVRPGGLVSGHDYLDDHQVLGNSWHSDSILTVFEVKRAVDEFFRGQAVHVTSEPDYPTWWLIKP